jgi:hypothetical protein
MAKIESSIPISVIHNNLKGLNDGDYIHLTRLEKERLDNTISDKNYVHIQGSASDVWLVDHNLDKFPSVTIIDSANNTVVGEVKHISANQTRISFTASFSGKAFFN